MYGKKLPCQAAPLCCRGQAAGADLDIPPTQLCCVLLLIVLQGLQVTDAVEGIEVAGPHASLSWSLLAGSWRRAITRPSHRPLQEMRFEPEVRPQTSCASAVKRAVVVASTHCDPSCMQQLGWPVTASDEGRTAAGPATPAVACMMGHGTQVAPCMWHPSDSPGAYKVP